MSDEIENEFDNTPTESDEVCAKEQADEFGLVSHGGGNPQQGDEDRVLAENDWAGSPTAIAKCHNVDVPSLIAQLQYQYRKVGNTIYVRTLRYHMTTRFGNWDRGNINFFISAGTAAQKYSPDTLSQNVRWHSYQNGLSVGASARLSARIEAEFDGTDNDAETEGDTNYHDIPVHRTIDCCSVPVTDAYREEIEPNSAAINSPLNNATVRNAGIDVTGTLIGTGPVLVSLFTTAWDLVSGTTASINGGNWSSVLAGPYPPGTYYLEVFQTVPTYITIHLQVPAPIIDDPRTNGLIDMPFPVTGKNGVYGHGSIRLYTSPGNVLIKSGIAVGSNGGWTSSITLPANVSGIVAKQWIGAFESTGSNAVTGLRLNPPQIDKPTQNETVDKRPLFAGKGIPGSSVTIRQTNPDRVLASAQVGGDGEWSKTSDVDLSPGSVTIKAKTKLNGLESPETADRSFTVGLEIPRISLPASGSTQDTTFTLSGINGQGGAEVQVLLDLTNTIVGRSAVTGSAWSSNITMQPGQVSLVAKQVLGGQESPRSEPRPFKIRPDALTAVTVSYPTANSVKFSGDGHTGATVVITIASGPGGTAPSAVLVAGGKWETIATNWPYGTYTLTVIQKVPDNAGGWIESLPYTFSLVLEFPDPRDVESTPDYQTTISGTGLADATVTLTDPDKTTKVAPDARVTLNGRWLSQVFAPWGPTLNREVHIRQSLNNQHSNWVVHKVSIAPKAPVIDTVPEEGLSPLFSGTCWLNAVVELVFSDSGIKHPAIVTGTTWSFLRPAPFAPDVSHTVTATQTAAQQTSVPATETFVVYRPMLKPGITDPAENAEVGRDMTVQGTSGMAGATMQLRDAQFGRDLGAPKTLTTEGIWAIELKGLEFRPYTIDAKQEINGRKSARSDPRPFEVVLLPPQFTSPVQDGSLTRTSMIEGKGMPGGKVDVFLQGLSERLLEKIPVDIDGIWKGEVTLPVGNKTIWAKQYFEGETSQDSPLLNYKVVPAPADIETPASGEHAARSSVVSGFGVPRDRVKVMLGDATGPVLGETTVEDDRTWSMGVVIDRPGGPITLVAVASCDGFESVGSPGRPVILGTFKPTIESPSEGQWASNPVHLAGQGRPGVGQVLSWFNPDQAWAPNLSVANGTWQGDATDPLPPGGNWCEFWQTLTGDPDGATISDQVTGQRFEVEPPPPRKT